MLNSANSSLRTQLDTSYNDAAAIEMESAGVATATHLNGSIPTITIRGISDKADGRKRPDDDQIIQPAAAENAAAFAVELLRKLPDALPPDERSRPPTTPPPSSQQLTSTQQIRGDGPVYAVQNGTLNITQSTNAPTGADPPPTSRLRPPRRAKVLAAVTAVIIAVAVVVRGSWFHSQAPESAGGQNTSSPPFPSREPVYATATEQWDAQQDPVMRVLPNGLDPAARAVLKNPRHRSPQALGVPLGISKLSLVVQAKEDDVRLQGLRLMVDSRKAPMASTLLYQGTQGEPSKPIAVFFDTDGKPSSHGGIPALNAKGEDYFDGLNVPLAPGRSEEFRVQVTTRTCYCTWHFAVDVISKGRRSTVEVFQDDDQKRPFGVTAVTNGFGTVWFARHPTAEPLGGQEKIGIWERVPVGRFCGTYAVCDPRRTPEPQ